jgi:hypothetical protein
MSSPAQLHANRNNAQLSTGPRTQEGKDSSSANATQHGWTSQKLLIPGEDLAEFERTRAALLERYAPANGHESELAERVVQAWWRLRRMHRFESELFNHCIQDLKMDYPSGDPGALLFGDERGLRRMNLFLRYMNNAQRDYKNAVAELERVQIERKKEEAERAAVERIFGAAKKHPSPKLASFGQTLESPLRVAAASQSQAVRDPRCTGFDSESMEFGKS